ncbi:hypothetical protein PO571_16625 [Escherichia coli]|uniref:Tape measure protein n=1 Tax=Escherichia coli O111 TaxID=1055535 RepID=A0AAD2VI92_ECOLX|nr:hypothetical protein [Escherichia coli]ELP2900970.1 hypothetical protein [Escherichia coli O111]AWZ53372.1 hypothetical protein ECRM9131_18770 [Escherichia coli]AWZ58677.1 hypothetical protein ECRM9975_18745 [Escherichia coli]EHY1674249.1 hypothetical protein [Escherichia coli]HCO7365512.1 hypothetical protein [Escherichia coli]
MLEINTSKIKNTVTFSVDKDSLKKAKDSITGLKEFTDNIKPAKLRFDNVTKGYKKAQNEVDKIAQQKAKTEKQNQRAQAAAARAQARQQAQIAARSEKAALKLLDVGSSISAMHRLSVAEQYKAIAQAREIAKQYEQGAISLARMNSQMKRLQQQQRKINGNRKAQLAPVKGGSGNSATMGALLFGGATAAAGVMAVSKASEFMANSFANAETQGELIQRARLGGVDVNQMYNITEWAYKNGVDSMMGDQGARKYLDQMKDVRERAAKSYSEAEYVVDKKTGKGGEWKGGDNAINELLNIGVINKSDLKKFADNPAGLISKAVNGMMKKGFSDSQIGQRLEDLGDDLMLTSKYWQRSVKDVQESINQQKASGKWLTETQQESIVKFRELNRQLSQLSDARQVAFVDGFMKSLDPKVTEEFMKNLSNLTPYFTKLGEAAGSLFEAIMKIVNWFNRNDDKTDAIQKNMGDAPPLSNEGMKQNLSNLVPDQYKGAGTATTAPDNSHSLFNTIKGLLFDDNSSVSDVKMSVSEAPITNLKQGALNNLAMTTPAYNLSPVFNLNPTFEVVTEVPLTINSDTSRLSDYVDFTARASRDSFLKSLTLTSLSGQSNGG